MPLTISWKEEGRVEGRMQGTREMLRVACESRFGRPSPQIEAKLAAIVSVERLQQLMRRSYQVESWDDLLADPN